MSHFYILFSIIKNKYYVGITQVSLVERLEKHNSAGYGSHYTSTANDWEIKLSIECLDISSARRMELYVKKMKSRRFIEKIINDPIEQEIFIQKFSI